MRHIEGQRVVLREFRRDDIPRIQRWVNDPQISQFLLEGYPQTLRETQQFVETQMNDSDPLNRSLAIALREDLTCIGTTGCHQIDWRSRCAELGILIGPQEYLGRGYGTEAIELALLFGFKELNLHRVFLRVLDFNERAIKSYRKCGFVEEGRMREACFRQGGYHDIVFMAILEDQYAAQKEKDIGMKTR